MNELDQIIDRVEAIKTVADKEDRDYSDAETTELEGLFQQAEEIKNNDATASRGRQAGPNMTSGKKPYQLPKAGRSAKFKDLFKIPGDLEGFQNAEEFYSCIARGLYHPSFKNATMTEGVGADGGFMVPTQLLAGLMDASLESEIVRPRSTVYPMQSASLGVAGVNTQDHSTSLGGLTGTWMAEATTATAQKALFRKITLGANKLGIYAEASNELVADGLTFEQQLSEALTAAIGFDLDEAFLVGNGTGKPVGALSSANTSKIVVSKESGQTDTLTYANLIKMQARLHPALWTGSVWVANPTVIVQLYSMFFSGTNTDVPVFMPASSEAASPTLFGRPVLFSEKVPVLGDAGDISLVNFSQYAIGMRMDASLAVSAHEGFMRDTLTWRLLIRCDGQPRWSSAMTPRNGDSLSWCVTLEERA